MRILENLFEDENETQIPDFYVYTSGKGNKYFKKGSQWFNLSTKKPVPSTNIQPLEAAARKSIEKFNSENDVKIGTPYTSKNNKTYIFNGSSFVGTDGKVLTGGAAKAAFAKLSQQSSENSTSDEVQQDDSGIVPGESAIDDTSTPSSSTDSTENSSDYTSQDVQNQSLGSGESQVQDSGSETPSTGTGGTENNNTNTNSNSELDNLARSIKSNKYSRAIITLLAKGGDLDLIAADILLNSQSAEAIKIINALNSSNTQ